MRDASRTERGSGRRWAAALALGVTLPVFAAASGLEGRAVRTVRVSRALAEPRELLPLGDYTHAAAGFAMPRRVGPFERADMVQYDQAGYDVSARYVAVVGEKRLPIVVTVYVYPRRRGQELDSYFDALLDNLGRYHGGARPEFRKSILLAGRFVGRYAFFGYAEPWGGVSSDVPLRSYVVLYPWRGWWVKWRATTPAPIDDERMRAIVELTETLLPPAEADEAGEPDGEAAETDLEPRLASRLADEQQVGRLHSHAERPDRGAAGLRPDPDLAALLGPRGGERAQAVVGSRDHERRRAVVGEREPLARAARERRAFGCRAVHVALGPVLFEDVHPLRVEQRPRCAHARPGRAESSAVRMRTTCCAVNRNIAASST